MQRLRDTLLTAGIQMPGRTDAQSSTLGAQELSISCKILEKAGVTGIQHPHFIDGRTKAQRSSDLLVDLKPQEAW